MEPAQFNVGDFATEVFYTDREAGRIIEVRRNGREVVFQQDTAARSPDFQPRFIPGGFAGYCYNQDEQFYTYEPNPQGRISVHTLRTWRGRKCWTRKHENPNGKNSLIAGQSKYHDYNF